MQKQPHNVESAKRTLDFFAWAFAHGDQMALDLGYVPLPRLAQY